MSTKAPIRRGRCRPTGAWIASYKGKRGVTYRVRWFDPRTGETMSKPCGRDKAHARQCRDAMKAALRVGLSGKLPDKTIADLKDGLGTFMVSKSPHTIRKTRQSLQSLIDLCRNRRLEFVDRAMLMDFRAKRLADGVAVATVNKDTRQIKSALSYAVDAGWLRDNPLWRWKAMQLREPETSIRVVEPQEFESLLKACPNPVVRVLLITAYYQGLRRAELSNLRWSAVDLDVGVLHVVNVPDAGEFTKSRKNRSLPLHETVRQELTALRDDVPHVVEGGKHKPKRPHCFTWDDGRRFKPDWLTHEFAKIVKRSKIAQATLHDLRRSFSTLAQRAGVDKNTVKDLGGWSTVAVVEKHYTGEVPEVLQRAMTLIQKAQGAA